MTKDIVVGDELPDWVGAKEFYQKYDPKEVIGRLVHPKKSTNVISILFWDDEKPILRSIKMISQGCKQRGAEVCAQTHRSGAGSEDY